jgi:hypothetical protein
MLLASLLTSQYTVGIDLLGWSLNSVAHRGIDHTRQQQSTLNDTY